MSDQRPIDLSMGRLGREGIVYGLSFVASRAASVIMLPLYTRLLSREDYGILQLVERTLDVVVLLLCAGLTSGAMRFYFKGETEAQRHRVFPTALYLVQAFNLLACLVLFLASFPAARWLLDSGDRAVLLQLAAVNVVFESLVLVPMLFMQVRQEAKVFTAVSLVRLGIQIVLNILFLSVIELGVKGPLLSALLSNVLLGPWLVWRMFRTTGWAADWQIAIHLWRFGIPYRIAQCGTFILAFGDTYFLKIYRGLAETGLYGLAYKFGFLLVLSTAIPFLQAWNPQRFALSHEGRAQRDAAYNRGLLYYSLLLLTAAVGICLFVGPLLDVMSSDEFHAAAAVVPILVLAYAIQAWTDVAEFGIQVSERTKWATLGTWIAVGTILVLYWLLIPWLGSFGAAIATLVAFSVRLGLMYSFSQRLWPIAYDWAPTLRMLAVGIAVVVLSLAWHPENLLGWISIELLLFATFLATVWYFVVDPTERQALSAWARAGLGQLTRGGARG